MSDEESRGTAYDSFEHLKKELREALRPYRALLQHELRSADFTKRWYEQDFTTPWEYRLAYQCTHQQREPVRWMLSNGVERAALQCVICGDKHSAGVKKSSYPNFDSLPELDEGLQEAAREAFDSFRDLLHEIYDNIQLEFRERQEDMAELERLKQDRAWWEKYTAYLDTAEWASKRKRVFERDAYTCQACLRREATAVHHLTYEHVFNEPLFDLTSVCDPCHEAIHPHLNDGHQP